MSKREDLSALSTLNLSGCVPSCKLEDLNPSFVEKLLFAQRYAGFQFTITSAYRSQGYEREKGRKGDSSHCKGLAVDISTCDSHTRYKVVLACAMAGIPRIGIGKNFVHVDVDETKAHPIIFHYYD